MRSMFVFRSDIDKDGYIDQSEIDVMAKVKMPFDSLLPGSDGSFPLFQYVLRMLGGDGNEMESIELLRHFISSCHCNEQGLITKENFIRALSKNELLCQLLSPFT